MKGLRTVMMSAALVATVTVVPIWSVATAQRVDQIVSQTVPQMLFQVANPASLTAHEIVTEYSGKILTTIEEGREKFEDNPELLTNDLLILLDPVVDFKAISKAVMGKHRKAATPEQREQFAEVFKLTMVRLYTKALVTLGVEKVLVLEEEKKKSSPNRAKVVMEVGATDETSYSVIYTMRRNKQKEWRVRNMILDGINLGLTYLNQFDSAMNRHEGDIEKVIASWGAEEE